MRGSKLILDLGCGSEARHSPLAPSENVVYLNREESIGNRPFLDVIADAKSLPFRENVFGLVWCDQVLEHLDDPIKGLREMIRVAESRVVVRVPHKLVWKAESPNPLLRHKYPYNVKWFVACLSKMGFRYERDFFVEPEYTYGFPVRLTGLVMLPQHLKVSIWKSQA